MASGVDPLRGKREGNSFQVGHYYPVVSSRKKNDRSRYPEQNNQKYLMTLASSLWNSLSSTVQAEWVAWATFLNESSRLRDDYILSGFNLFVRRHVYYWLAYGVSAGVMSVGTPVLKSIPAGSIYLFLSGGSLWMTFASFYSPVNWDCFVYCSPPMSPGTYVSRRRLRFIKFSTLHSDNYNVSAAYLSAFGVLPVAGQVVYSLCHLAAISSAECYRYYEFATLSDPSRNIIT